MSSTPTGCRTPADTRRLERELPTVTANPQIVVKGLARFTCPGRPGRHDWVRIDNLLLHGTPPRRRYNPAAAGRGCALPHCLLSWWRDEQPAAGRGGSALALRRRNVYPLPRPHQPPLCNALIAQRFTADNGATQVVPGHIAGLSGPSPPYPRASHRDQCGHALIWNGSLWHTAAAEPHRCPAGRH